MTLAQPCHDRSSLSRQERRQMNLKDFSAHAPNRLYRDYYDAVFSELVERLPNTRFWKVVDGEQPSSQYAMVFDTKTKSLWDGNPDTDRKFSSAEAKPIATELRVGGLQGWHIPSKEEIGSVVNQTSFPLRKADSPLILNERYWVTPRGSVDCNSFGNPVEDKAGCMLCINMHYVNETFEEFLLACLKRQWALIGCDQEDMEDFLGPLRREPKLKLLYPPMDFLRARLPVLEEAQFTDPAKGLWELWGMDPDILHREGVRARNPAVDVKDWNVAIDFGTSSTVVAYTENGQHKLLRIGVDDFWAKELPQHYENPTVLELVDFPAMLDAWQSEAYRPLVLWDDVRCSHEALENFRNNGTNPKVVASVLTKIKQWALREGKDARGRITDQANGVEHELAPLTLRQPVKGQKLTVGATDPFDPVELYAWFLGLAINWRGRGLFLRYYMTFPVAYPKNVKDKILASFRRGLQRSLPVALVEHEAFQNFAVEERASEPAAYAAAALPALGIEPTSEGVPYAVFDFGGGTADFDFGIYRLPTEAEEDGGTEKVFEHFGASGDPFLGGENLLENIAYQTFRHNLTLCREKKIGFTRPLDADDFPGSEMFLERTQAAITNTLMLMARLRPLWETGTSSNTTGVEKIQLLTRDGQKIDCELVIPIDKIGEYLEQRIEQGIQNFLAALKKAFASQIPQCMHILLAGNASRSRLVLRSFGLGGDEADGLYERTKQYLLHLFGESGPKLIAHAPLETNPNDLYHPTCKTGVALGLLHLCPGTTTDVINHASQNSGDEAPFAFYVGRIRLGKFQAQLVQGAAYHQWYEIGPPRERVFNLVYTQSPKAHTGEMHDGEAGLIYKRLDLAGNTNGCKVFARAVAPDQIEICTALDKASAENGQHENLRNVNLS